MSKKNLKYQKQKGYTDRLHTIWHNMIERCENPKHPGYQCYGAHQVRVVNDWLSFTKFLKWANEQNYKDYHHLVRINKEGNFSPTNCLFVEIPEYRFHKRRTYREFFEKRIKQKKWKTLSNKHKDYKLYSVWKDILLSCAEPSHPEYKANLGCDIKICEDWLSDFRCFRNWSLSNGYEKGMHLVRINPEEDFHPNNCLWSKLIPNRFTREVAIYSIWTNLICRLNTVPSMFESLDEEITEDSNWGNSYNLFREWVSKNAYREDDFLIRLNIHGEYSADNCKFSRFSEEEYHLKLRELQLSEEHPELFKIWRDKKKQSVNPETVFLASEENRRYYMVPDWFYNFDKFLTWSLSNGYQKGMQLWKKDHTGNFSPYNCYYSFKEDKSKTIKVLSESA